MTIRNKLFTTFGLGVIAVSIVSWVGIYLSPFLTFIIGSIFIFLGIITGYFVSTDIVKRLSFFRECAQKIRDGDLNQTVPINSEDELGDLARSFNAMTLAVKYSNQILEDEIKSRTKRLDDLSKRNAILLESIGDGIIAIDMDWNIIEWNSAAAKLTGWSRGEVVGKPFRDYVFILRERDRKENLVFIEEAMLYGVVKSMENHTIMVRKDKSEVYIGDSAAPILDENKKVVGVIIVFRDMTEELESQSMKTDFKYAAHQMRTPVTKVLWNLESAIDSKDDIERKNLLIEAHNSARSISKMNDQLLAISDIDQKIIIPDYEIIDIAEAIDNIIERAKSNIESSRVKITFLNKVKSSRVETDKKLLTRSLIEIVDNGIIYNKPGGEVNIILTEDGPNFMLEVRDNGIGISEEQAPSIFTKFFRGNNYDTSKIPGAGIGLFISLSYINLLKGKIWFKSKAGIGTSFFMLLPKLKQ